MNSEEWIEPLTRPECLGLLATIPVGRVVFTECAMPAACPVNFIALEDGIVFRTHSGGILDQAVRNSVVGFEADAYDARLRAVGWGVLVVGPAVEVTDVDARKLLDLSGPGPGPAATGTSC
jgi:hypothetical protein